MPKTNSVRGRGRPKGSRNKPKKYIQTKASIKVRVSDMTSLGSYKDRVSRFLKYLQKDLMELIDQASNVAVTKYKGHSRVARLNNVMRGAFNKYVPMVSDNYPGWIVGGIGSYRELDAASQPTKYDGISANAGNVKNAFVPEKSMSLRRKFITKSSSEDGGSTGISNVWKYGWWFNQEFGKNPEGGGVNWQENTAGVPFSNLPGETVEKITSGAILKRGTGLGVRPGRFLRYSRKQAEEYIRMYQVGIVEKAWKKSA